MRSSILSRKSPRRATRAGGFSLVELIVSIVVLGILAAVTAPIFSSTMRAYVESDAHLATLSKARYAVERIARELREVQYSGGSYAFTTMAANSVAFTKLENGNPIAVTLSSAGPNVNLRYAPPGITAPLTDELSSLTFTYLPAAAGPVSPSNVAAVTVTLTLTSHGATYTQRAQVGLRNTQ